MALLKLQHVSDFVCVRTFTKGNGVVDYTSCYRIEHRKKTFVHLFDSNILHASMSRRAFWSVWMQERSLSGTGALSSPLRRGVM